MTTHPAGRLASGGACQPLSEAPVEDPETSMPFIVPAPLCLPSNPGFSLQGGLEKVHPQQEGGAGLAPAQGRGYAASIRDKSEQAWATFLLKPAPDWGVKGVTACMGTGTVSTHLAKVNHTERKLRPLKSVDRGGRCSSASSSLSGGWQPQREWAGPGCQRLGSINALGGGGGE